MFDFGAFKEARQLTNRKNPGSDVRLITTRERERERHGSGSVGDEGSRKGWGNGKEAEGKEDVMGKAAASRLPQFGGW